MPPNAAERVSHSFPDNDHDRTTKYIDWILASIANINQSTQRRAATILLLMAIFEIAAQWPQTKITFLGFSISHNSITFTFVPVVVAYLYFQVIVDSIRMERSLRIFEAAFKRWSPEASRNDLHVWLLPATPLYWNEKHTLDINPNFIIKSDKLELGASYFLLGAILIGVLAFEVQAFYILFNPDLKKDIPWFINMCISLCLLMSTFIYINYYSEEKIL